MSLGLVIGDLRGCVFAGQQAVTSFRAGLASHLRPVIAVGTAVKRKMAGSEESDKYKKKIFQKVGLFMIRHYL